MGAWGTGNWENDDALDWIADPPEPSEVEAALLGSLGSVGACCRALAAAEIIAAWAGRPSHSLPEAASAWVSALADSDRGRLVTTARDVVRRIAEQSELQGLFDETARDDRWHAVIEELLERLSSG